MKARSWLAWVEEPSAAGIESFRLKEVQTPENTRAKGQKPRADLVLAKYQKPKAKSKERVFLGFSG